MTRIGRIILKNKLDAVAPRCVRAVREGGELRMAGFRSTGYVCIDGELLVSYRRDDGLLDP